jgi:hypothetical protein
MSDFRKSLIVCLVTASFVIAPLQTFAWQSSGCGGCNGSYFETCVDRFNNKVDSFSGWGQVFSLGCSSCSEDYYKSSSYGGSENSWVDATDIHFRNSHCGTAWDSYWGKYLSSIPFTDGDVTPGEAHRAWGDYNLEWMASKCCSLLRDDSRAYWYTTFDGLHLMLGFKTSSYGATNFGRKWAERMKKTTFLWITWDGQTVTQAWFNTTDETQPSGTTARVLAEVYNNYNDHLWGQGYVSSDPSYNGYYWYWDHVAGSPPYLSVNSLEMMNVYRVIPRNVDEQYTKSIGRAFGLTGQVGDLCDSLAIADVNDPKNPKLLKISKASGQFYFQNQGKLFAANPDAGQFPPEMAEREARNFLDEYKLLPQDAGASTVEFDTLVEESDKGVERQRLFQNTNVVFARQLPADPAGGQMVSVAGAGARLKVYLYGDSQNPEVMGAMGNWRNVEVTGAIQVNDFDTTWSFFDRYKEAISPAKAQVVYNKAVPIPEEATQGYYEHPGSAEQQELIPCWIIPVEYYQDDTLVLKADTFVPAAKSYFPPVVDIIKPAEFQTFKQGETIDFDCQVVEGFGTPPYNYNWESNVDGVLSTQKSFQTDLLSVHCPDTSCDCKPLPHTITLTVTDSKGSEAEDTVVITVEGPCDECTDCADLNRDNIVNLKDLAIHADRYLTESIPGAE